MLTGHHRRLLDELVLGAGGLAGGAEITISDADGHTILSAPLARHYRHDPDGTLWIRPIVEPDQPGIRFSVTDNRPRGLRVLAAAACNGQLRLQLPHGQQAVVRPAGAAHLELLDRWDAFYYALLTGDEQAELDALEGTDWQGRYE